jgi:hypothetical protein
MAMTNAEACRRYYYRHRDEISDKRKKEYADNPSKFLQIKKQDYEKHREKRIAYQLKRGRKLRMDALNAYSNNDPKCECCGEKRIEFLALDHPNGEGKKHRESIGIPQSGAAFYHWLWKNNYPEGLLRVLCHNCNLSRGFYGYCPHEGEKINV